MQEFQPRNRQNTGLAYLLNFKPVVNLLNGMWKIKLYDHGNLFFTALWIK